MHWIDLAVFMTYMAVILGVGWYFMRRNKGEEDYFLAESVSPDSINGR
jgi:SSS family solute:Na+ symporter